MYNDCQLDLVLFPHSVSILIAALVICAAYLTHWSSLLRINFIVMDTGPHLFEALFWCNIKDECWGVAICRVTASTADLSYVTKCVLIFLIYLGLTILNDLWWYRCAGSGAPLFALLKKKFWGRTTVSSCKLEPPPNTSRVVIFSVSRALQSSRCFHVRYRTSDEVVCLMVNLCSGYSHRPVIWPSERWGWMGQAIDRPETESSAVLLCRAGHTVRPLNRCRTQPPSLHTDEQLYFIIVRLTWKPPPIWFQHKCA